MPKKNPHITAKWPRTVAVTVSAPWLEIQGYRSATFETVASSPEQFRHFRAAAMAGYFSPSMATALERMTLGDGA